MGKSPKPLRIAVDNSLRQAPEVLALAAKGHEIVPADHQAFDIVIGPRCWRMTPELMDYLDLAVKAAWEIKYPGKGKKMENLK